LPALATAGRAWVVDDSSFMTREEIAAYLRWLADQPDGINHRTVLFVAAWMLTQGMTAIRVDKERQDGDQVL